MGGINFFLFMAGSLVGFTSGLTGLGGGILLFPFLFYLPVMLGMDPLTLKGITGLTMAQAFFASLAAVIIHRKNGFISRPLVYSLGVPLALSALAGATMSSGFNDDLLLTVFAILALIAAVMMFMPRSHQGDEQPGHEVKFNKPLAIILALGLGYFLGMVGQGGAFIVIPLMLYVLKIPMRTAVGSMLAIGVISATAGFLGKASTGQVPLNAAIAMLTGTVPFAIIGAYVSRQLDVKVLRWVIAIIIGASAIRIAHDIILKLC